MRPAVRNVVPMLVGWVIVAGTLAAVTFVVVGYAGDIVGRDVRATGPTATRTVPGSAGAPSPGDPGGQGTQSGTDAPSGTTAPSATQDPPDPDGPDVPGGPGAPGAGKDAPSTPEPPGPDRPEPADPAPTTPADPGTPTRGGSSPTPTPSPSRTSSFNEAGGSVTATCRGKKITVDSIRVADGWSFDTKTAGRSDRVSVTFANSGSGSTVTIEISCVGGKPEQTGRKTSKKKGREATMRSTPAPAADAPAAKPR
ncbi:hypothetical protein JQN72_10420 [Phycicoccus sp. CSK15P-2]|uniref:hypothetical protein n=1 Tax=Phycicoccus sp. CSK15P-2 TaxID=2807627 RepID=UPI00194EABFC|nr:hypothetical protein [Phycicoccus sp. CSK15P-2]MBM6404655.1 hypothetical protein [Phycicoccus sp. CSK15P-2]